MVPPSYRYLISEETSIWRFLKMWAPTSRHKSINIHKPGTCWGTTPIYGNPQYDAMIYCMFFFIQSWYSSRLGKNLPISLCCSTFRLISFIFGGYQFFCYQNILERVERLLTEPLVRVQGLLMEHLVCVWSDFPITTLLKMGLFTFLNNKLLSNLKNMG